MPREVEKSVEKMRKYFGKPQNLTKKEHLLSDPEDPSTVPTRLQADFTFDSFYPLNNPRKLLFKFKGGLTSSSCTQSQ